jgi:hypothetical protein
MKILSVLALMALASAPGQAQQEQLDLIRSLRTASLMRLVLALSSERMPELKPEVRSKALGHLKVANRKIAAILDNPKLPEDKKKQRLIQAQNAGALSAGRELGAEVKKLKAGFLSLKGEVFWDVPVYGGFSSEALKALKKQVQAAEMFGGSSDFFISGWGDVG